MTFTCTSMNSVNDNTTVLLQTKSDVMFITLFITTVSYSKISKGCGISVYMHEPCPVMQVTTTGLTPWTLCRLLLFQVWEYLKHQVDEWHTQTDTYLVLLCDGLEVVHKQLLIVWQQGEHKCHAVEHQQKAFRQGSLVCAEWSHED